ncbi:MAG: hypothetical protein J2P43_12170 [Candidatus Dormibacteraeota bacterium]|nr:hypothetical protein [Candidatus Dormibacteraeota bacterium]
MTRGVPARLARIPVRGAMLTGAVAGVVPGLFLGCLLGAFVSWASGAVVYWQKQLGFTLGVSPDLLPFGDQGPLLSQLSNEWPLVVPAAGVAMAIFWGVVVSLSYGLLAAALNLLGVGAVVRLDVDVDDRELTRAGSAGPPRSVPGSPPEGRPGS